MLCEKKLDVAHDRDARVYERLRGVHARATRPPASRRPSRPPSASASPTSPRASVTARTSRTAGHPRAAASMPSRDGSAVTQHLVQRDGERRVVAVHDHRALSPTRAHVDAGLVHRHRARVIVRGHDADALALRVLAEQPAEREAVRNRRRGRRTPPRSAGWRSGGESARRRPRPADVLASRLRRTNARRIAAAERLGAKRRRRSSRCRKRARTCSAHTRAREHAARRVDIVPVDASRAIQCFPVGPVRSESVAKTPKPLLE